MQYELCSFRYGLEIFENNDEYQQPWDELQRTISELSDESIIDYFNRLHGGQKSISKAINYLLDERLSEIGWDRQSAIFNAEGYSNKNWTLDFAKYPISVEVAFNHGEAISWNLLKPVLASELNHVEKAIQTRAGVIICATDELKREGGFDSAVGTYEKFLRYLNPMRNQLTVPMVIIGLRAPETFRIRVTRERRIKIGHVEML